jgi:integrase/recombinase XerD
VSDGALIDRFLEMMAAERGASRNTLAAYARDLAQAAETLRSSLGDADLDDLRGLMAAYRGLAASSAARKLSALRQFYAFLVDEGDREDNPARAVRCRASCRTNMSMPYSPRQKRKPTPKSPAKGHCVCC